MRRAAVVAALLLAVLLAAPAAAQTPLPGGRALVAQATVSPDTHLFGDTVSARVDVVIDPRQFDPDRLRVALRLTPYEAVGGIRELRRRSGGLVHVRYDATLRCLHVGCLAAREQSTLGGQEEGRAERRTVALAPVEILYREPGGREAILLVRHFPAIQVVSRLSTAPPQRGFAASLDPPAPTYRVRPELLAGLAAGAAGLLLLLPAALLWRVVRARRAGSRRWRPLPPLERALTLVDWTARRPDGEERRKALESLAVVLERRGERELAAATRSAAWAEEPPPGERAGALGLEARRKLNGGEGGRTA